MPVKGLGPYPNPKNLLSVALPESNLLDDLPNVWLVLLESSAGIGVLCGSVN